MCNAVYKLFGLTLTPQVRSMIAKGRKRVIWPSLTYGLETEASVLFMTRTTKYMYVGRYANCGSGADPEGTRRQKRPFRLPKGSLGPFRLPKSSLGSRKGPYEAHGWGYASLWIRHCCGLLPFDLILTSSAGLVGMCRTFTYMSACGHWLFFFCLTWDVMARTRPLKTHAA